jgi:hypothetical protein
MVIGSWGSPRPDGLSKSPSSLSGKRGGKLRPFSATSTSIARRTTKPNVRRSVSVSARRSNGARKATTELKSALAPGAGARYAQTLNSIWGAS